MEEGVPQDGAQWQSGTSAETGEDFIGAQQQFVLGCYKGQVQGKELCAACKRRYGHGRLWS